MFNCNLCHYVTDRSSNLKKHNETKKHIINVYHSGGKQHFYDKCTQIDNKNTVPIQESNEKKPAKKKRSCECGREFNNRQALWSHRQICKTGEQTEEFKELKLKVLEMDELKEQMAVMQKTIQQLTSNSQTKESKIMTNSNNTNISNMNSNNNIENNQKILVFNYVGSNFKDTEPIKMLEKKDIEKLLTLPIDTTHTLVDFIIYHHNTHSLNSFLGEIIIGAYKKEDQEEQQFWTSSVMKLTFIVRQILNKENVWLKDMNGVCITKHIVDPMLKVIKKILQKYVKQCEQINKDHEVEEIEKIQTIAMIAIDIIKEINDKVLHLKILKYVAPHFQLEQNTLLIED